MDDSFINIKLPMYLQSLKKKKIMLTIWTVYFESGVSPILKKIS